MSWSASGSIRAGSSEDERRAALAAFPLIGGEQAPDETKLQFQSACAAAESLMASGAFGDYSGSGEYSIQLSGHANKDGITPRGAAQDYIAVSVRRAG